MLTIPALRQHRYKNGAIDNLSACLIRIAQIITCKVHHHHFGRLMLKMHGSFMYFSVTEEQVAKLCSYILYSAIASGSCRPSMQTIGQYYVSLSLSCRFVRLCIFYFSEEKEIFFNLILSALERCKLAVSIACMLFDVLL